MDVFDESLAAHGLHGFILYVFFEKLAIVRRVGLLPDGVVIMLQYCLKTAVFLAAFGLIACDRNSEGNEVAPLPQVDPGTPQTPDSGANEQNETTGGDNAGSVTPPASNDGQAAPPAGGNQADGGLKPSSESCENDPSKIFLNNSCVDVSTSLSSVLASESPPAPMLSTVDAADCRGSLRTGKSVAQILVSAISEEDLSTPGLIEDSVTSNSNIKSYCFNVGNFVGYSELLKQKFAKEKSNPAVYAKCRNLAVKQILGYGFQFVNWSNAETNALILWPNASSMDGSLLWTSIIKAEKYTGFDAIHCAGAVSDIWQARVSVPR